MMMSMMRRGQHQVRLVPFARCFMTQAELAGVKREDVVGASDSKWVGSFAKAVVESGDSSGAHSDALDEYFRKNFRKLSAAQAMDVLN